ncbi:MAG: RNA polymerase sigma factor [Cytophagales bacterium]|nr:RNA polymerase sigma factor [Bernardetiaceae bacterium]MDW8205115.1 RNA polymerase sigma factor [Cytophagales bacterium]
MKLAFISSKSEETSYCNQHQALIEACRQGDSHAQYRLYSLYAKAMYNTCLRITGNTAMAEDALQETFLTAFQKIDNYRGAASFGAWLKRIAINAAINHTRKWKREWLADEPLADIPEETPETDEELPLKIALVQQAIQQLPDGFRIVFSLYAIEGYEHSEIADILGISVSTSKTQYSRAKAKLQKILLQKRKDW